MDLVSLYIKCIEQKFKYGRYKKLRDHFLEKVDAKISASYGLTSQCENQQQASEMAL